MTISDDTRALLQILQRAYPWARYVSRSRGDVTRSVGALRLHELPPEATEKGFAPTGKYEDLPPELLPEAPEGVAVKIEILMEANMDKQDMQVGLCLKYDVTKVETGEKVNDCFVLRPDKDPAAATALRAYALVTPNKALANDIMAWVGAKPVDKPRLAEVLGVEVGEKIRICGECYHTGEFCIEKHGFPSAEVCSALIYAINYPESIIRIPRLTEAEIAIMRAVGAKWVSRGDVSTSLAHLWDTEPRKYPDGVYRLCWSQPIATVDSLLFPSVKPGECVGPVEFEGLGKKDG